MTAIPSSVSARVPATASLAAHTTSDRSSTQARTVEKSAAAAGKAKSAIGPLAIVTVLTGICVAVGGVVWAVELDVPYPLAIMAGYCSLMTSACLCAMLMVLRKASTKVEAAGTAALRSVPTRGLPNYAAWKLESKYSVSDASRLWCDIEPGCPATQESIAWAHA